MDGGSARSQPRSKRAVASTDFPCGWVRWCGAGVEWTFPAHSPVIAKIEPVTRGDVRRAKLYYLSERTGNAAKIKEKRQVTAS